MPDRENRWRRSLSTGLEGAPGEEAGVLAKALGDWAALSRIASGRG